MKKYISYGKQYIDNLDILSVKKSMKSDMISSGKYVLKFENELKKYFKSRYSLVCNSGTSGLFLAFNAIDLKKNDIVLMPAINFIASYSMCSSLKAKIFLIDVDRNTGQISYENIINCIKKNKIKKIKLLITMHLGGSVCDNIKIYNLKKKYNFYLIEDACHAMGSEYIFKKKKYKIGSCKHSDISVFSFHPLKSITTGEGGAINTNKKSLYNKILLLRSHGIMRRKNQHWNYEINHPGFNYRLSDINCALGISQLKKLNKFLFKRKKIFSYYVNKLSEFKEYVKILNKEQFQFSSCHLLIIKFNLKKMNILKNEIIKLFYKKKIILQQHYKPIHRFNLFKKDQKKILVNSQEYFDTAISFPIHYNLTRQDVDFCIKLLIKIIYDYKK